MKSLRAFAVCLTAAMLMFPGVLSAEHDCVADNGKAAWNDCGPDQYVIMFTCISKNDPHVADDAPEAICGTPPRYYWSLEAVVPGEAYWHSPGRVREYIYCPVNLDTAKAVYQSVRALEKEPYVVGPFLEKVAKISRLVFGEISADGQQTSCAPTATPDVCKAGDEEFAEGTILDGNSCHCVMGLCTWNKD